MDGLTASVSTLILFGFLLYIGFGFIILSSIMILTIIGALIGFLYYNWNPSRIYMGDSGSQFLGIALAHLSILLLWKNRSLEGGYFQVNQFFLPFMIFTIPIFDTTTVTIHRLLRRQSPFVGGKDHLSHHLVFLGLRDWQSVSILAFINLAFIILSYFFNHPKYYLSIFALWLFVFICLQYFYIKAKNKSLINAQ
jgi:UDP-GlcNAc:undecaprenyl-phosphate GlcNAc-1-phosphate transferase